MDSVEYANLINDMETTPLQPCEELAKKVPLKERM